VAYDGFGPISCPAAQVQAQWSDLAEDGEVDLLQTLKGRTALAAALLAGGGIAAVTSLQSNLSQRSVIASTQVQHENHTSRVAGDIDSRLRLARSSLSEFAANIPGSQIDDPGTLQYYLTSRVGIQQAFESIAVYGIDGRLIASRPSMPPLSVAPEPWFVASLRAAATIGEPMLSRFSNEPVVPLTYRVHDEAGLLRGVAVGTLPISHEQLLSGAARDAGSGHFILLTREERVVLHPDLRRVGQGVDELGLEAAPIRAGLKAPTGAIPGPDHRGVRSLYAFRPVPAAGWTLVGVVSNEEAYASLDRLSRQMLLAGGLLALLLIPAMWALVARMLRPLDGLRREMRCLRDGGDLEPQRVMRAGTEELRQVVDEFAAMAVARRGAEQALQQEKERAEVTLQSIADAVVATDRQGRIAAMNVAAERLTGWRAAEALGRSFAEVVHACDEATGDPLPDLCARAMEDNRTISVAHAVLRDKQGALVAIDNSASPIHSGTGAIDGAVVVFRNVAVARAAAHELSWRASHDVMTGLVNRTAYEQALATLFVTAQGGGEHSVIMLDLDQFKIVNDSCGHAAGDELLRQLAAVLVQQARKSDLVARLGGDEFAVLMYQCSSDNALRLAEKLRRAVADWRFCWEGQTFRVGASIGVVALDASFANATEVQKAADMACYMAKRTGRNRICVHTRDDRAVETVRLQMQQVSRVQEAIDGGRLRLYAQPIQSLDGAAGARLHFEVLVRLLDESGELVPPGAFLPAAERYGLMDQLDRWVVQHTVEACARRFAPNRWHELDTVAINLSAVTLRDASIGDFITGMLQQHGMPARCVCVEITETAAMEGLEALRRLLQRLRAEGMRVALDDFGVGMTSLSQLRDLPVDVLKIDGSFIKNIDSDALNSEMVDAIQRIATRLGMRTVAECVENTDELAHLRRLGVHWVQGYLLARPAPLAEVIGLADGAPAAELQGGVAVPQN
jgi:diguanylate cyclase (GGDEF)-like protein/PAS domain S-box-containing protein